ncbi:uncharacterized protein BCR38DRAFT_404234 [Pseudomassariella vexata]|uniref:DUF1996 domain-containing protein n=1 Tax=Pseudomassariella vexata TaxID=1141098 RepID=A0A1Y2EHQ8_9PEZI|nr:uncharacterized protein BCR38DRAFT_404234 [Pseudomassariella vexata]ORY71110.1 hypothetical protein BCR38DRAFT_404234 [Pseudomassariella vexata]
MKFQLFTGVALQALTASAFWRLECRGRLALARMDPMMSPDEDAAHAHAIHGSSDANPIFNSGFSESASYDDLMNGDCTSCAITQDKSAYWTPAMYFKHADGTYEIVPQVGGMLAYYLPRGPGGVADVKAFPKDFRMIAGSNYRRNFTIGDQTADEPDPPQSEWAALNQTNQYDLAQRSIGFNCLDYNKAPEGALYRHYMPDKAYMDANCLNGTRLEIAFPACWNGKDVDSDDHQSHVAYPDLVQDGECPEGFDVRLPTLFFETIWDTYNFYGKDGIFTIANGDPTGFGYHGDFINGWDPDFLQEAVTTCTNLSGLMSDCPLFDLQTEAEQQQCTINPPSSLAVENVLGDGVDGVMTELPGNVQIQYGPEQATPGTNAAASTKTSTSSYVAPTLSYQSGTSTWGGIFAEETTSSYSDIGFVSVFAAGAPSSATPSPVTTTAPASTPDAGVSYEPVTTEYKTNSAGGVLEVIWEEAVVYVTEDLVTTTTVTATPSGAPYMERRSNWLRHRHHGHGR